MMAARSFAGVTAGVATAFGSFWLTGVNHIGYNNDTRIIAGTVGGAIVAFLASCLAAPFGQIRSASQSIGFSIAAGLLAWDAECLLLPGTNAGFTLKAAISMTLIGAVIGAMVHGLWQLFAIPRTPSSEMTALTALWMCGTLAAITYTIARLTGILT